MSKTGYVSGLFENPLDESAVNLLLSCRRKCDMLVVGLYSDDLALRLLDRKAARSYDCRKSFLEQFRFVDEVVEVGWENIGKRGSWERVHYDICFCGCEYGALYLEDKKFLAQKDAELGFVQDLPANLRGAALRYALKSESCDKDIVLFGTGKYFDSYMDALGTDFPPCYAVDNDKSKHGSVKRGVKIFGVEKLKEASEKKPLVGVCAKKAGEMTAQLETLGGVDFRTFYSDERLALYDEWAVMLKEEDDYVKESHRLLMILLKEFDRVCSKYNLKYFLNDGSLIGAVRHQALIPWDDDADVSMFRDDYEKLLSVAEAEWCGGDFAWAAYDRVANNAFHDFMSRLAYKKERLRNIAYSKAGKSLNKDFVDAMVLDIYVLDNRDENPAVHKKHALKIEALYGLAMGHRDQIDYSDYAGQRLFVRLAVRLLSFAGKFVPLKLICKLYERTCRNYSEANKNSGFVFESNAPLCCLFSKFDKRLFGEGKRLKVYGQDIMVPEHCEEYLETHGYHNFMQYPPANMRKPTHSTKSGGIMYKL